MVQWQGVKNLCIPYRGQTQGLKNVAKNPVKKKKQTFYERNILSATIGVPI